jgi:hypothetical protein
VCLGAFDVPIPSGVCLRKGVAKAPYIRDDLPGVVLLAKEEDGVANGFDAESKRSVLSANEAEQAA